MNASPALLVLAGLTMGSPPPLTDPDRAQLDDAVDGGYVDEGSLYPLLRNAMEWIPGNEGDARIPDYDALLNQPADFRGQIFLVEGRFARHRRFNLARPGPWGDAVTEWVVLVRQQPDEVAVIFFVDPQATMPAPRQSQPVRVAARFYKVWRDRDANNQPSQFLVFVARSPRAEGGSEIGRGEANDGRVLVLLVLVLLLILVPLLAILLWQARKAKRLRMIRRSEAHHGPADHHAPSGEAGRFESHFPEDPAQALAELNRRREQNPPSNA